MRRLAHRRALVTGGGRGIGRAIALAFAREGAAVSLAARTAAELEETAALIGAEGGMAATFLGDVSEPATAARIVGDAARALAGLDVLVNAAGSYGPIGPLEETDPAAWLAAVRTNLFATYLCARAALPHLRSVPTAAIINLSGGGATSPLTNFSAYAASKAAVVRLTETLHAELAGTGVRVYAIAPGAVNTRMLDEALAAGERAGKEFYARALEQKRTGGTPPERASALAVFLATEAATPLSGRLISAVWDPWEEWERDPALLRSLGPDTYTLRRLVPARSGE